MVWWRGGRCGDSDMGLSCPDKEPLSMFWEIQIGQNRTHPCVLEEVKTGVEELGNLDDVSMISIDARHIFKGLQG